MSRINLNLDGLVEKIEKTVASHKIGKGDYARWLWQNKKNDREMGSNPYGVADAANILYTTGAFPQDDEEREGFIRILRNFQDPESGLFHERTHHTYHTTAHCTAALELFDKYPLHPFKELKQYDDITTLDYLVRYTERLRFVEEMKENGFDIEIVPNPIFFDEPKKEDIDDMFDTLYQWLEEMKNVNMRRAMQD